MRPLIVLGASPGVRNRLEKRWPGEVIYADAPMRALDELEQYPNAVLAYGPGIFGAASTRQPARIYSEGPQVAVTDSVSFRAMEYDDPRALIERAVAVLRVPTVLNISSEEALAELERIRRRT